MKITIIGAIIASITAVTTFLITQFLLGKRAKRTIRLSVLQDRLEKFETILSTIEDVDSPPISNLLVTGIKDRESFDEVFNGFCEGFNAIEPTYLKEVVHFGPAGAFARKGTVSNPKISSKPYLFVEKSPKSN